jgi:PIN domain nuclease of toxin-antitoxin system
VILLDTHIWLWWLSEPDKLSPAAAHAIERAKGSDAVHISAISAWEVAMLIQKGRLDIGRSAEELCRATEALPFVHFVDVDPRVAVRSVSLDLPHPDPADRLIAATSNLLGAPLVTADRHLRNASAVETVW